MTDLKWIVALCAAASMTACGQKGALYLPDHNGSVITRPGQTPPPLPSPGTPGPGAPIGQQPAPPAQKPVTQADSGSPTNPAAPLEQRAPDTAPSPH